MNEQQVLAGIAARHDQDEAAGRDWFSQLTATQKVVIWLRLNGRLREDLDDPFEEAMALLARLQFEQFFLDHMDGKGRRGGPQ
jgi:hypothetical protein